MFLQKTNEAGRCLEWHQMQVKGFVGILCPRGSGCLSCSVQPDEHFSPEEGNHMAGRRCFTPCHAHFLWKLGWTTVCFGGSSTWATWSGLIGFNHLRHWDTTIRASFAEISFKSTPYAAPCHSIVGRECGFGEEGADISITETRHKFQIEECWRVNYAIDKISS